MIHGRTALFAVWLLAVVLFSETAVPAAAPYPNGAAPGFSGGFGEQSCHACHFEADLNATPGQLTITGVPERFVAGQQYEVMVTLTRPGMALAGFQLAARLADGGAQAGTFALPASEKDRLLVQAQENVHYVNQRRAGTAPAEPGKARWTVLWTAPAATGAVLFHVAANAADNDESIRGDYVYTATVRSAP